MTDDEGLARSAEAILLRLKVTHHVPPNADAMCGMPRSAAYWCDWCCRPVAMAEMFSHGGRSSWASQMADGNCWKEGAP